MRFCIAIVAVFFFCEAQAQRQPKAVDSSAMINRKMKFYTLISEGDVQKFKGDLAASERSYLKAKDLGDEFINEDAVTRISILNMTIYDAYDRLGDLYLLSNNPTRAEEYYFKSKELRDKNLPKKSAFRILPRVGLGKVYLKVGNIERAAAYLKEAEHLLTNATTSFYNYGPLTREFLFNQFEVAILQKDYKRARKAMEGLSSGGILVEPNSAAAEHFPKVFEVRGRYYMERGNYGKAAFYFTKAKAISEHLLTSVVDFRILKSQALLKWTENDIAGATKYFSELISAYRNYIATNFAGMSEPERESFFSSLRQDFELFYAFAAQNQDADEIKTLNEMVYDNQLFSKALLLNEINKMKLQIRKSDNAELKSKLAEWESKKATLASLYYSKEKTSEFVINDLQRSINDLERDLNRSTSLLRVVSDAVTWKDVQRSLGPNEAAIEIIRLNKFGLRNPSKEIANYGFTDSVQYLAMIVTQQSTSPECMIIDDGNSLETKFMNFYRNSVLSKQSDTLSYNKFWKPIRDRIGGIRRVYISADGIYNQINLNTLYNSPQNKYLLDELDLVLVTNTKDIVTKKENTMKMQASLYGRPFYKLDSSQVIRMSQDISDVPVQRSLQNETLENFRNQDFADLPGTEREVRNVENMLREHKWTVSTNFGARASEMNLKADENPSVLHIATHGFFLPAHESSGVNSMIRSGIILAGVNHQEAIYEDGILTAYEATNLTLDSTQLIVLSACDTGLGQVRNGEGVYGLQRGFAVAGAQNLLMSLWKVDDFATSFLMEKFYLYWLNGMEIHLAMKSAQSDLRKQYPEPYYWGAFVLLGN